MRGKNLKDDSGTCTISDKKAPDQSTLGGKGPF